MPTLVCRPRRTPLWFPCWSERNVVHVCSSPRTNGGFVTPVNRPRITTRMRVRAFKRRSGNVFRSLSRAARKFQERLGRARAKNGKSRMILGAVTIAGILQPVLAAVLNLFARRGIDGTSSVTRRMWTSEPAATSPLPPSSGVVPAPDGGHNGWSG